MNIQQFYYFEAVARHKSFTKAAEELMTTQSCLSHSLGDLESELSIKLIEYKNRTMELTTFGELYLSHVQKILKELTRIELDRKELLEHTKSSLRIAFTANLSYEWIPSLIREFKTIQGNEDISFIYSETVATKRSIDDLKNNKIDLFFGTKVDNPDIDTYLIVNEDLYAMVPQDSVYAKQEYFRLQDLNRNTLIAYSSNTGSSHYIASLLSDYNIKPARVVELETEKMMASAISSNLGIAIMPMFPELHLYNIKPLSLNIKNAKRPLHMIWIKEKNADPLVRRFISFVKNYVSRKTSI